ncbi:hypothetical protein B0J18DRAFT_282081 [Chaetomium sp. MPI-SDFR-AT-0129]|nr:hypothetical protein B0J18DRAFT_282081 [Chaetomium sp. MPI-SDFR-AT-0129]
MQSPTGTITRCATLPNICRIIPALSSNAPAVCALRFAAPPGGQEGAAWTNGADSLGNVLRPHDVIVPSAHDTIPLHSVGSILHPVVSGGSPSRLSPAGFRGGEEAITPTKLFRAFHRVVQCRRIVWWHQRKKQGQREESTSVPGFPRFFACFGGCEEPGQLAEDRIVLNTKSCVHGCPAFVVVAPCSSPACPKLAYRPPRGSTRLS